MRPETQRQIDALHAQIDALVYAEKAHYRAANPDQTELQMAVAQTRIGVAAWHPRHREQGWATASFPTKGST